LTFTVAVEVPPNPSEIVYANVYDQWGEVEYQKVMDMITSIFEG